MEGCRRPRGRRASRPGAHLGNKNLTGTLVCEHGSAKERPIRAGSIVNAASNDPREYLGSSHHFGHITEDRHQERSDQTETRSPGAHLVMIGVLNGTAQAVLTIKFARRCSACSAGSRAIQVRPRRAASEDDV
jgi:hypothetical protein